jgi:GT2 family glycosyltransferase
MNGKRLSIVISSWNDLTKLRQCLDSIYRSTVPHYEIIVVDNDSRDGTQQHVREFHPHVRLQANRVNVGHTRAINAGMALAQGTYILILDSDTELATDCLDVLLAFMDGRPDVIMVAPRTFNSDGTVQETARNFPGVLNGLFGRQSRLTRMFPDNPFARRYLARSFLATTDPFQVEQISGACMLFRRNLLTIVGAWDETFFGYWVDTDWCRSIARKGEKIYCVPAAHLIHHENNARGKRKNSSRVWMFHYGAYLYFTKWHTFGRWDPRSILAGLLLLTRALLKMTPNVAAPAFEPSGARPRLPSFAKTLPAQRSKDV